MATKSRPTLARLPAGRDLSLTGPESARAVAAGLADAEWYHPPIAPDRLAALMVRTNGQAARDTVAWLTLVVGSGVIAYHALGSWWAVPAFVVYGALYGGAADARWHECGHGTAFRGRLHNDAVYTVASFMLLREPTFWRWSHFRHHSDTIVVGRDPEIAFPRPFRWRVFLPNLLNLRNGPRMVWRMARHAAGSLDDETRELVPRDDRRRLVIEAQLFVAVLAGVIGWSVVSGSIVPLLFVGLPSFYGVWLMTFFGITQHAGLREDVLDHRANTRTVYMNPVLRFLYLNMNYHVEHHLFPSVPYHALPALHDEIKHDLPRPNPSVLDAYREIATALREQRRDPSWEVPDRWIPAVVAPLDAERPGGPDTPGDDHGVHDLGAADELRPGEVRRVDLGDATYLLCRTAPDVYALTDGLCTHGHAVLADGLLDGNIVECPKHNGRFDVRTGEPVRKPAKKPLTTYRIDVVDGRLVAEISPRSGR